MIFIDTGAFLARFVLQDQFHEKAEKHWNILKNDNRQLYTSNFILDEAFTLLARKTTYKFASEKARTLLLSKALIILRPDAQDEFLSVEFFDKFADQEVSFTDCVSFVLMKKYNIKNAFTFDRHFSLAGFVVEPILP